MSKGPTKRELEAEKELEVLDFFRERAAKQLVKAAQKDARAFTTRVVGDMLFIEALELTLNDVLEKHPIRVPAYKVKKKAAVERILNLVISDTHFQSLLRKSEVLADYGSKEEARRLAHVALETAKYKPQYRDQTTLHIQILGDIIAGLMNHDPRVGAPLADQFAAAGHLFVQAIAFLATQFPKVIVHCTPGNHGRNIARHHGLAVHQKWDGIETMVYKSIQMGLKHIKNVEVEIPYTPFFIYDAFGSRIMGTHGDTVIKFGNVESTLNVAQINQNMSEFNDGLERLGEKKVDVICGGHVHWATRTPLSCGTTLIVNPALIPSDGFAVSIGKLKPLNAATLFESVKGHPAGDYRLIEVDESVDKNAELDKFIQPYEGL